jgi:hypothetical protein
LIRTCAAEERRRILTTSLAGIAGDFGEVGWYDEAEEDFADEALEGWDSPPATAGGGSSKDICREEKWDPSFPLISVEEAGVGGWSGRGIIYREFGLVRDFSLLVSSGLTRKVRVQCGISATIRSRPSEEERKDLQLWFLERSKRKEGVKSS